ncbi:unnamed protein product [Victoria cruziana]
MRDKKESYGREGREGRGERERKGERKKREKKKKRRKRKGEGRRRRRRREKKRKRKEKERGTQVHTWPRPRRTLVARANPRSSRICERKQIDVLQAPQDLRRNFYPHVVQLDPLQLSFEILIFIFYIGHV